MNEVKVCILMNLIQGSYLYVLLVVFVCLTTVYNLWIEIYMT